MWCAPGPPYHNLAPSTALMVGLMVVLALWVALIVLALDHKLGRILCVHIVGSSLA
jgi:hypothetical protein